MLPGPTDGRRRSEARRYTRFAGGRRLESLALPGVAAGQLQCLVRRRPVSIPPPPPSPPARAGTLLARTTWSLGARPLPLPLDLERREVGRSTGAAAVKVEETVEGTWPQAPPRAGRDSSRPPSPRALEEPGGSPGTGPGRLPSATGEPNRSECERDSGRERYERPGLSESQIGRRAPMEARRTGL